MKGCLHTLHVRSGVLQFLLIVDAAAVEENAPRHRDSRAKGRGSALALWGPMPFIADPFVHQILGYAIRVHTALGPGLYESVYEACLAAEFDAAGIGFDRQVPLPVRYLGVNLPCVYRMDLVIDGRLLVELKTVDRVLPVHRAQILTYLRLSGLKQGLLINFNVTRLMDGVSSFLNGTPELIAR
jgi:GxxExxY protein